MSNSIPALSIIIVTLKGLDELAVPLPGILSQTIAARIELVIVALPGMVTPDDLTKLAGLHSVRLVERPSIGNRGRDAGAGVAVAAAPFVALHENHTRAEPETYERLLAAMRPGDAAVCPIIYPANGEMAWGNAMYALAHAVAAPPSDDKDRTAVVLHSALYRIDLLRPYVEQLAQEAKVQTELNAAGYPLRFVPGTVVWHVNEARPRRVMADCFTLGRDFGYVRSRAMPWHELAGRAALLPAIAAKTVLRCLANARRATTNTGLFLASAPPVVGAALAFATGEVLGYFDQKSAWSKNNELHEFHVRGRLNGEPPAALWLARAISELPEDAP